ncbi:unnamed protein product [Ixodes pacificus]
MLTVKRKSDCFARRLRALYSLVPYILAYLHSVRTELSRFFTTKKRSGTPPPSTM